MRRRNKFTAVSLTILLFILVVPVITFGQNKNVFIRYRVKSPNTQLTVTVSGYMHVPNWRFPQIPKDTGAGVWSEWIDLSSWNWHTKHNRSGGFAEYPAIMLRAYDTVRRAPADGCEFDIELADSPNRNGVVKAFTEKSTADAIVFLVPFPLRENIAEFETGTQIAARHAAWAKAATGGKPINIKQFEIATNMVMDQHPDLTLKEAETLKSLGFNAIGGVTTDVIRQYGTKSFSSDWSLFPDPQVLEQSWNDHYGPRYAKELESEEGRFKYSNFAYIAISDEIRAVDFRQAKQPQIDIWFRDYLRTITGNEKFYGTPISTIEYPTASLFEAKLNRDATLGQRRLLYQAAKFGQSWSTQRYKQTGELINRWLPDVPTNVLLPSHGFFGGAWGPQFIGMSYRMMDLFDMGRQRPVDQIAVEDWFGMNHMYGPDFTWSGAQSFAYFNALTRSAAIRSDDVLMRGFMTPSDDKYLRLKAYSSIGQGAKSLYYWSYGPTMVATENYWSDLRSEYDGIVKINRAIEKTEDVLMNSKPVSDPVAIMYSVSQDIWYPDLPSVFSERRLLWHALRHVQIQPDFVDETDCQSGALKNYNVLYLADWNISRAASGKIDEWVKNGGVLYMSAGAATRDEYNEPYLPPFSAAIWKAKDFERQQGSFNERNTLKTAKPLTSVRVGLESSTFELPVLGARADMKTGSGEFANFSNGETAARTFAYGKGKIVVVGFMPMLAYGQSANFLPTTLSEKWKPEARSIISLALDGAKIKPVAAASVPVVETNLLKAPGGLALVLVNYTYQPIKTLQITVKTDLPIKSAASSEGVPVKIISREKGYVVLEMPLEWTDIVVLK